VPQILVYNKFDKLEATQRPRNAVDTLELDRGTRVPRVFVSAIEGQGLDDLRRLIGEAAAGTLATRLNLAESASSTASDESSDEVESESRRTGTQNFQSSP
jgi:GTPase